MKPKDWHYSITQFDTFETCDRKYRYKYKDNLDEPPSLPAAFSSICIHKPISMWYQGQRYIWDDLWNELEEHMGEKVPFKPPYTQDMASRAVQAYINKFQKIDMQDGVEIVAAEKKFQRGGWTSIPDVVLRSAGGLISIEIKAVKWEPRHSWEYDRQILGEIYATRGQSCIVRIILLRDDPIIYSVGPIVPSETDMREWLSEKNLRASQIDMSWEEDIWPKKAKTGCTAYNQVCAYKQLCDGAPQEVWDGWKRREKHD